MSCKCKGRIVLFVSVLSLSWLHTSASHLLSSEKQSDSKAINYKLVSNLQEMKDHPQFTLPNLEGGKVGLKDFRGKLLMLNFWASWCAPCREEMPAMQRLYHMYKDVGFVILGVNVKDEKKSALSFVKELKITFPPPILSIPRESLWRESRDLPIGIVPAPGSLLRKYWTNRNDRSMGSMGLN